MIPPGICVLVNGVIIGPRGKPLKGSANPKGYRSIKTYRDGKQITHMVHVLVCEAFHGPKPTPKHEVCHNDGNPANNAASNLRWGTKAENAADRVLHGIATGADHYNNRKTHCPAGHEYTPENTYVGVSLAGSDTRTCRECNRESSRKYRQARQIAT